MANNYTFKEALKQPYLFVLSGAAFVSMGSLTLSIGLMLKALLFSPNPPGSALTITVAAVLALALHIFSTVYSFRMGVPGAAILIEDSRAAKAQTDELFAMTDMLQSADGYDDATSVLRATSLRLLPEFGASLYIFNNSRDRLDLAGSWNMPDDYQPGPSLAPSNCWALKRGKPHINHPSQGTLCCTHHGSAAATLELPMMARGSVYGLLTFAIEHEQAQAKFAEISRLGHALADSMSLALSNIALREKLRTQSLRDPLTGLYNRRYMEDALERYVSLAERTGGSTVVMMLDLDNFKRLNDEHGHAKGDAVLRDVAAQLVGGLRPADVICRYGGEELMAILPNCSLADAMLKAEVIRERIEGLSDTHEASISASFGLASIPETSTSVADIVPMADAALYEAKRKGKNCLVAANRRAGRDDIHARLVKAGATAA